MNKSSWNQLCTLSIKHTVHLSWDRVEQGASHPDAVQTQGGARLAAPHISPLRGRPHRLSTWCPPASHPGSSRQTCSPATESIQFAHQPGQPLVPGTELACGRGIASAGGTQDLALLGGLGWRGMRGERGPTHRNRTPVSPGSSSVGGLRGDAPGPVVQKASLGSGEGQTKASTRRSSQQGMRQPGTHHA